MKSVLAVFSFGLCVAGDRFIFLHNTYPHAKWTLQALPLPGNPPSIKGQIKQLDDGQNRIGGGRTLGTYHIVNGSVWDEHGRGCILTPATTQWQCDEGVPQWNIYAKPAPGQRKCVPINLYSSEIQIHDTCSVNATSIQSTSISSTAIQSTSISSTVTSRSKTSTSASITSSTPTPSPKANRKRCPVDLEGAFEFPHLIVPIDRSKPHEKFGNHLNGTIKAPDLCTGFNFDVHTRFSGKTCSVIFFLPEHEKLQTSSYELKGSGGLVFAALDKPMDHETSWSTKPGITDVIKIQPLSEGAQYHVFTTACPAGKTVGYGISIPVQSAYTFAYVEIEEGDCAVA
ncbi:hypothetical protein BU24DRAFT_448532 [Aaosphaeria arxii CBS 175.79]|uniref:Ubiquitin 3 binding protein But2 C-terminal domain-containing protein n=1 Tax=Aaosphaeria arxii CBS 175.79 TaxID=1450172 RepID=A0A6A5Y4K6_9PLEO|nr:uncharacterized protein BU24DRAFT_448532 [Aaosphaeria arxii CBS 175.79]KAF2020199.1 hypothetical protein BU24DRAFT_448532 [Aaosphaeria arxii CBS 175.79]